MFILCQYEYRRLLCKKKRKSNQINVALQVHSSKELAQLFEYDDSDESQQLNRHSSKMELLEKACKNRLVKFVTHRNSQVTIFVCCYLCSQRSEFVKFYFSLNFRKTRTTTFFTHLKNVYCQKN